MLASGPDLQAVDEEGKSALHMASDVKTIRTLVDAGAPVNLIDRNGETPIFHHAARGNVDAVRTLVTSGARVDIVSAADGLSSQQRR